MSIGAAIKNLLLVGTATALPLIALEIGIRKVNPQYASIYTPDDTVLFRLVPNGRRHFVHRPENGSQRVQVDINGEGFRNAPISADTTVGRVVVYGDSFVEGEFSPDSQTFARVLERELRASRGPNLEVVNAGVVGYGPDQALLRMRRELSRLRPKAIVLVLCADNDMGDLMRDRIFRLNADSQVVPNAYVLDPAMRAYMEREAEPGGLRRMHLVRWVERKLDSKKPGRAANILDGRKRTDPKHTVEKYVDWSFARAAEEFHDVVELHSDTVRALLGDHYDADVTFTPDAPAVAYKKRLMAGVLAEFKRTADSAGVMFSVVVVPSAIDACDNFGFTIDSLKYPQYDRARGSTMISELSKAAGIPTLNLYAPFRAANACKLYFPVDAHWNSAGQALAAKLAADSVVHLVRPARVAAR